MLAFVIAACGAACLPWACNLRLLSMSLRWALSVLGFSLAAFPVFSLVSGDCVHGAGPSILHADNWPSAAAAPQAILLLCVSDRTPGGPG